MAHCDVVKDLIPLVNDGVASDESRKTVYDHCESCGDCKKLLSAELSCQPKDEKIVKALKRSVFTTQLAIVSAGILIGIWFTGSNNTFYNFYIMPIVGGLSCFILRKKSLYVPLVVFVLTELFQILKEIPYMESGIVENLRGLGILLNATLPYAGFYALLCATGIAIFYLLSYAFGRDKH